MDDDDPEPPLDDGGGYVSAHTTPLHGTGTVDDRGEEEVGGDVPSSDWDMGANNEGDQDVREEATLNDEMGGRDQNTQGVPALEHDRRSSTAKRSKRKSTNWTRPKRRTAPLSRLATPEADKTTHSRSISRPDSPASDSTPTLLVTPVLLTAPYPTDSTVFALSYTPGRRPLSGVSAEQPDDDTAELSLSDMQRYRQGMAPSTSEERELVKEGHVSWSRMSIAEAVWRKFAETGGCSTAAASTVCRSRDVAGEYHKPDLSLPQLVRLVIASSPLKALTLNEIYQAFTTRWPYFRTETSWKNTLRHHLSHADHFQNTEKGKDGRNGQTGVWSVCEAGHADAQTTSRKGRTSSSASESSRPRSNTILSATTSRLSPLAETPSARGPIFAHTVPDEPRFAQPSRGRSLNYVNGRLTPWTPDDTAVSTHRPDSATAASAMPFKPFFPYIESLQPAHDGAYQTIEELEVSEATTEQSSAALPDRPVLQQAARIETPQNVPPNPSKTIHVQHPPPLPFPLPQPQHARPHSDRSRSDATAPRGYDEAQHRSAGLRPDHYPSRSGIDKVPRGTPIPFASADAEQDHQTSRRIMTESHRSLPGIDPSQRSGSSRPTLEASTSRNRIEDRHFRPIPRPLPKLGRAPPVRRSMPARPYTSQEKHEIALQQQQELQKRWEQPGYDGEVGPGSGWTSNFPRDYGLGLSRPRSRGSGSGRGGGDQSGEQVKKKKRVSLGMSMPAGSSPSLRSGALDTHRRQAHPRPLPILPHQDGPSTPHAIPIPPSSTSSTHPHYPFHPGYQASSSNRHTHSIPAQASRPRHSNGTFLPSERTRSSARHPQMVLPNRSERTPRLDPPLNSPGPVMLPPLRATFSSSPGQQYQLQQQQHQLQKNHQQFALPQEHEREQRQRQEEQHRMHEQQAQHSRELSQQAFGGPITSSSSPIDMSARLIPSSGGALVVGRAGQQSLPPLGLGGGYGSDSGRGGGHGERMLPSIQNLLGRGGSAVSPSRPPGQGQGQEAHIYLSLKRTRGK